MIDNKIIGEKPKTIKILQILKRIISIIISIFFIFIIIVNVVLIIKMAINPEEIPDFLGYKSFVITTGSMEDTINIGDYIITKTIEEKDLKEQDIVSFRSGQNIITHRIVKIEEKDGKAEYTTKGDNNNTEDISKLTVENIEGKYLFTIPFVGHVVLFAQSTSGMIVLLLIPVSILIFTCWKRQKENSKILERDKKRIEYEKQKKEEKYEEK